MSLEGGAHIVGFHTQEATRELARVVAHEVLRFLNCPSTRYARHDLAKGRRERGSRPKGEEKRKILGGKSGGRARGGCIDPGNGDLIS